MDKDSKIYIAGHKGLVGSAVMRSLLNQGYSNLVYCSHQELDLTNQKGVISFFEAEKPEYVILAAAKVGGIHANNTYPADFIFSNLAIQTNVIDACYRHQIKRLIFLGSSCIYPKEAPQPIKEADLLTGPLEETNRPYALAKIAGVEMCWSYNRQYKTKYLSVMPTNLYGLNDNYDLENSHVIPALIRKIHEAKIENKPSVVLWGSGKPKREFLYCDDLAHAILFLLNLDDIKFSRLVDPRECPLINVGSGEDLPVYDLAELISSIIGFKGKISLDISKPDGTMRKVMDVTKVNQLGWSYQTKLKDGLSIAYQDFLRKHSKVN
jgi:GDP-L-fucose synthase